MRMRTNNRHLSVFQTAMAPAILLSAALLLAVWLGVLTASPGDGGQPSVLGVDRSRLELGEAGLRELEGKAAHSPCWRDAVERLDLSCRQLGDMQQSRLAVAFANCHLAKSGRRTYPCSEEMSVLECTEGMDGEAYQTYTHFFTHTGHICYFLQIELWQGRTEGLIGRLSDTSTEALQRLEQSLDYHRAIDQKQDVALRNQDTILEQDRQIASSLQKTQADMEASFGEMSDMAEQQKAMLGEMFGSLQGSLEAVQGLMSLMVVEFVGWGTMAWFCLAWLAVMLLPQFHYSRFKLMVGLVGEGMVEVCVRRVYGYLVIGGDSPPSDLSALHNVLWLCRYLCVGVSLLVYVWEWYNYQDYGERNHRLLAEIRQILRTGRGSSLPPANLPAPTGRTAEKVPIPLPYVPLRASQPATSQPSLILEDFPDTPDSTESTPHPDHTSHHTPHFSAAVLSSDGDEGGELPDNDRAAARTRKVSHSHRVQRSSRKPPVVESRVEPSPSLPPSGLLSTDEEDTPDSPQALTRSPIHSKAPPPHSSSQPSRKTSRRLSKRASREMANRSQTSDSEPEKEVMEERYVSSVGGRRSLRSSDHLTGQLATPNTPSPQPEPHPFPPPSSAPKPHLRSRSATPRPTHRYNLRERTPQPTK